MHYIAFEGNEGTGKTVLSKKFAEKINAFWTYEPNAETEELLFLRKLSLSKTKNLDPFTRENALLLNRKIHQETHIIDNIENNRSIVTDRSFVSGMVYASLKAYCFEEWLELSNKLKIKYRPSIIIFCTSDKRRIDKEDDNIYDHASENILSKIDCAYLDALTFIEKNIKNIQIVKFFNDFNKSVEENCDNLFNLLIDKNIFKDEQ